MYIPTSLSVGSKLAAVSLKAPVVGVVDAEFSVHIPSASLPVNRAVKSIRPSSLHCETVAPEPAFGGVFTVISKLFVVGQPSGGVVLIVKANS